MKKKALIPAIILLFALLCIYQFNNLKTITRDFFYPFILKKSLANSQTSNTELLSLTNVTSIIEDLQRENQQLREILNLDKKQNYQTLIAEIIIREPKSWNENFIVNKGKFNGLRVGLPVLVNSIKSRQFKTKFSVAGRICSVSEYTAEVQTIFNSDFSFPVILSGEQQVPAVLQGGKTPYLSYFDQNKIQRGEFDVLSSPYSHLCPPYLFTGSTIVEPSQSPFHTIETLPFNSWADIQNAKFAIILLPQK